MTDDMKTKNRADRSGVVPVSASSKGAATAGANRAGGAPRGPPRFELEAGRKWVVENQTGNRGIAIEDTDPKQTVYVYNCVECTIQVKPPACCCRSRVASFACYCRAYHGMRSAGEPRSLSPCSS